VQAGSRCSEAVYSALRGRASRAQTSKEGLPLKPVKKCVRRSEARRNLACRVWRDGSWKEWEACF
jgi:hypothetical protein